MSAFVKPKHQRLVLVLVAVKMGEHLVHQGHQLGMVMPEQGQNRLAQMQLHLMVTFTAVLVAHL